MRAVFAETRGAGTLLGWLVGFFLDDFFATPFFRADPLLLALADDFGFAGCFLDVIAARGELAFALEDDDFEATGFGDEDFDFAEEAAFRLNRLCTLTIASTNSSFFIPCQPSMP